MVTGFEDILDLARERGPQGALVLWADTAPPWVEEARKLGLINPIFIEKGPRAAEGALDLLRRGEAELLVQGEMETRQFLDLVDRLPGIRAKGPLNYVSLFELPGQGKVIFITDTYINDFPDLSQKIGILENALDLAWVLGIEAPRVAALSALELVNPAMPSTLDAAVLSKMAQRGQFGRAIVEGPLALDNAVSLAAARRKGVDNPVSGQVDIYLVPDIEAGYHFAQLLTFFGRFRTAGALMGTKVPLILNLRFTPPQAKVVDLALGVLVRDHLRGNG